LASTALFAQSWSQSRACGSIEVRIRKLRHNQLTRECNDLLNKVKKKVSLTDRKKDDMLKDEILDLKRQNSNLVNASKADHIIIGGLQRKINSLVAAKYNKLAEQFNIELPQ
jgi:hypothetical protein